MAGKTPLLLASVLFAVGALGLVLTSAERASWGPFEPGPRPQVALALEPTRLHVLPPALTELTSAPVVISEPQFLVVAPPAAAVAEPEAPEPTPTPVPPLRVHGISADDAGVEAAAVTPPPPPPIRIGGISFDNAASTETPDTAETPMPAGDAPAVE